jgi:peptidoglycan/LPS O-acetylase OafA/YrhL
MLAAWAHLRRAESRSGWLPSAALIAGLAGLIAVVLELGRRGNVLDAADVPWMFFHWTLISAPMALIVYGAAAGGRLATVLFSGRALAFLGRISYSLYLWHGIVFVIAYRSGFSQWPYAASLPRLALWLTPVVILVSWVSYRLTERPFLYSKSARRPRTLDAPAS